MIQDEDSVGPHALILLGTLDLLRRGEDGSVPHILAARGPFRSGLRLAIEVYGVYGLIRDFSRACGSKR